MSERKLKAGVVGLGRGAARMVQERNSIFADYIKLRADELIAIPTFYATVLTTYRRGITGPTPLQPLQISSWNIHEWDIA
jgi:hypothetical protein